MVAGEGFEPSKVWGFTERPRLERMVAGEGFEPSKAEPGDLQSRSSVNLGPVKSVLTRELAQRVTLNPRLVLYWYESAHGIS